MIKFRTKIKWAEEFLNNNLSHVTIIYFHALLQNYKIWLFWENYFNFYTLKWQILWKYILEIKDEIKNYFDILISPHKKHLKPCPQTFFADVLRVAATKNLRESFGWRDGLGN